MINLLINQLFINQWDRVYGEEEEREEVCPLM